jgi:predicted TIM-barrel fold metal-dependent hydrolase
MAIVIHMRASIRNKRPYGAAQAQAFLDKVLPAAPDVTVQVAHLAGTGPGFDDPPSREVLATLAAAVERGHPATRKLWFDVASIVQNDTTPQDAAVLAQRLRQIGMKRILYGTDSAQGDNLRPREAWAAFRRLPLSEAEFAQIASNKAPYLE